ncbi:30S ribosomal protein S6 [Patescibacteria group bacterium]|nr:30S ribosomal protein S6 [Patescibacteria group bacterium]
MSDNSENSGKSYELLLVLAGSLPDSEKKKQLKKWEDEIAKIGKILEKTVWNDRALAYKIKQEEYGTYLIIHFETEGVKIAELENMLRLAPKVIRHLICLTPKNYEWREYSEEDLEYDFTKLKPTEKENEEEKMKKPAEKSFVKKLPAKKEVKEAAPETADTGTKETKVAKKAEEKPKADVGEIDKKLDDILADL